MGLHAQFLSQPGVRLRERTWQICIPEPARSGQTVAISLPVHIQSSVNCSVCGPWPARKAVLSTCSRDLSTASHWQGNGTPQEIGRFGRQSACAQLQCNEQLHAPHTGSSPAPRWALGLAEPQKSPLQSASSAGRESKRCSPLCAGAGARPHSWPACESGPENGWQTYYAAPEQSLLSSTTTFLLIGEETQGAYLLKALLGSEGWVPGPLCAEGPEARVHLVLAQGVPKCDQHLLGARIHALARLPSSAG